MELNEQEVFAEERFEESAEAADLRARQGAVEVLKGFKNIDDVFSNVDFNNVFDQAMGRVPRLDDRPAEVIADELHLTD